MLAAADNRKAANPLVLRVVEFTEVTSYIVIVEGSSAAQLRAIAGAVEEV
ncbi:RsfS/YbeB/iojap family protein [archaeon]|nr:MAG: RsfS/YbeB/iojap family protein [archaeon]